MHYNKCCSCMRAEPLTNEEYVDLLYGIDNDSEGVVSFQQFCTMLKARDTVSHTTSKCLLNL